MKILLALCWRMCYSIDIGKAIEAALPSNKDTYLCVTQRQPSLLVVVAAIYNVSRKSSANEVII